MRKQEWIRDYEKTKPRLFIRLLNADKYSADLQDACIKLLVILHLCFI